MRCVAVLESPAGGGAGGEDEVRPVHSPPGCAVDEDGSASVPVWASTRTMLRSPGARRALPHAARTTTRPEGTAEFCQQDS